MYKVTIQQDVIVHAGSALTAKQWITDHEFSYRLPAYAPNSGGVKVICARKITGVRPTDSFVACPAESAPLTEGNPE